MTKLRWPICWGRIFTGAAKTNFTWCSIVCSHIAQPCSLICKRAGRISSPPNMKCSFMILTSTYFEGQAEGIPKAQFGHSRDHRSDCRQVIIALIVTPDGFPLAYEVMPGNTSDRTTLPAFIAKIQTQYGTAQRIWIMDRGIPTEEVLAEMRAAQPPVHYLVGTPRGRVRQTREQWE